MVCFVCGALVMRIKCYSYADCIEHGQIKTGIAYGDCLMCTEFFVFKNFLYGLVFMAEGYVDGSCSSELAVFVDIECVCIAEVYVELFLYLVCKNIYSCTDNGSCDLVFL